MNNGEEVFVVLDAVVEIRYREDGIEKTAVLNAGDVFFPGLGST